MSDQSPRLIPFFLFRSLCPLSSYILSFLSISLTLCFFLSTLRTSLSSAFAFSLLPSFLPILAFSSSFPSSLPPVSPSLLLFFFSSTLHFSFFLSYLIRLFFTILLHFLVASYFVLPLLFACPSLNSFLYSLSPLFIQFHSSPILGSCLLYPCSPFIHCLFIFSTSLVTFHLYLRSLHLFTVLPIYSHFPAHPCRYWIIPSLLSHTYPPHNSRLLVLLSQIIYTPVP